MAVSLDGSGPLTSCGRSGVHFPAVSLKWSRAALRRDVRLRPTLGICLVIAISIANAINYGSYSLTGAVLLCFALVVAVSTASRALPGFPSNGTFILATAVLAVLSLTDSLGHFMGESVPFVASVLLLALGSLALFSERQWLRWSGLAVAVSADISVILSKIRWGRASIDVFTVLQSGSEHLLHGRNPYLLLYASTTPGQRFTPFPYGPGALLLVIPGRLLGDVRASEILLMGLLVLAIAMIARRTVGTGHAWPLLALVLACPFTTFMVIQSWIEVASVTGVIVWLWLRDHSPSIAVCALGLGLASTFLGLPLVVFLFIWHRHLRHEIMAGVALAAAITLPFIVWTGPVRYVSDVLLTPLSVPWRRDALGVNAIWGHLAGAPLPWFVVAGVPALLLGIFLSRGRQSWPDDVMSASLLLLGALLVAKFAFFNYYFIVAFGIFAALAGGYGLPADALATLARDGGACTGPGNDLAPHLVHHPWGTPE